MAEHDQGQMDIRAHERTFEGFIRIAVRVVIVVFAVLLFLAVFNS